MNKTFDCTGENLSSLNVQGALMHMESMLQGLRGGNVQFIAEYSKDDQGTTLTLRTLRDVPEPKAEPAGEPVAEPEVPAVPEENVQPARRGRKSKSADVVQAEGAVVEGQVNEQVEATGVT